MRSDDEQPAPMTGEARIGVDEVGGAMQRDDCLAGSRPAVDDEGPVRVGSDDRVLIGGDGAQDISHARGTTGAEVGEERGLLVERRVRGEHRGVVDEDLVPVVGDPAVGPAVAASAHQSHRVAAGGGEERRGQRGAPVDEQGLAGGIGQPEPADVEDLPVVADQPTQAQVEAEPPQRSDT